MAISDTAYSRLVAWLKVLLPLGALAILSTLFLIARTPDAGLAIPYAEVDVDSLVREPRVTEPDFMGVAPDGTAVSMTAASARPDPDDPTLFFADTVNGRIRALDGQEILLSSVSGIVDTTEGLATMAGDVLVETSDGFEVRTETLLARLDASRTESVGHVDVDAPFGEITAGRFVLTRPDGSADGQVLVFSDGVDLIYRPGN